MAECPICLADFDSDGEKIPFILECEHSLCKSCIKSMLKIRPANSSSKKKCPVCNLACMKKGINKFTKNFSLIEEISKRDLQNNSTKSINPAENHMMETEPGQSSVIDRGRRANTQIIQYMREWRVMLNRTTRIKEQAYQEYIQSISDIEKFVSHIHSTVDRAAADIKEQMLDEHKSTMANIYNYQNDETADLNITEALFTNKRSYLLPYLMLQKPLSEDAKIEMEEFIKDVAQRCIEENDVSTSTFSFSADGGEMIHSRIYGAVKESCKMRHKKVQLNNRIDNKAID